MDNLVKARVLKDFTSTALGNLSIGQIVNITPERLEVWKNNGMVEPLEGNKASKVISDDIDQPAETVAEKVENAVDSVVKTVKKKFGKKKGK